jgi:hypothetical protein
MRDLGARLLVIPFNTYLGLEGSIPAFTDTSLLLSTTLPDDSPLPVAVVDPIVALLDAERDTGRPAVTDAVHLMATTSAMRYQLGPDLRSMVLGTPDLGIPDPDVLVHLERFVAEHPAYSFEPIGDLPELTNSFFVDGELVTIGLADAPAVSLADRVQQVDGARLRIADVGSMLPVADRRVERWDADLRTALSTQLTDADAATRIELVDAEIAEVRDDVLAPETFSFTVTGREAEIPLRIENVGPTPLRVTVHVEAEKLNLPDADLGVVLAANAITVVPVPVTARSNGVFPVFVELRTPAGNPLSEPVELTARVSTLTGLGRVFTVGAILVLASWWFTYFRRRRRDGRHRSVAAARDRHPAIGPYAEIASDLSPDAAEARVADRHGSRDQ